MPDRISERAELARLLRGGKSIQMLAPRRVGKTWLMHRVVEDLTDQGWTTVFTDVEGMRTEDEVLRDICRKIEEKGSASDRVLGHLAQRLKQLATGAWEGNPINAIGCIDAKGFSEALVASFQDQGRDTLILIDEIALFVMARLAQDERSTLDFLYHLRRLRQIYPRVRWMLTGSIGLDVVARRAGLLGALVDLEIFPLEPFSAPTARAYLERRCNNQNVRWPFALDDDAFAHLARELGWLAPFYLDLIADRIQPGGDQASNGRKFARVIDIDRAFDEMLRSEYRGSFSTWEEHLRKNFPSGESELLHGILEICCEQPEGDTFAALQARLGTMRPNFPVRELKNMLTALVNDGFVQEVDGRWRFRSGLLRRYWLKYLHQ
jgi:hypothetical protein